MKPLLLAAATLVSACAHGPSTTDDRKVAHAVLEARSGSSVTGRAEWAENGNLVTLTLMVSNASPGKHAVHIHVTPDCSDPEAKSAGDHWNPTKEDHGQLDIAPFHLGDIGNLDVGPDGSGTLKLSTPRWSVDSGKDSDVLRHSIVLHASVDDLKSQPAGNAGSRIACGVITLKPRL